MAAWTYTLNLSDIFRDPERTFIQRRDAIVERIKGSKYYREVVKEDLNLDAWTRDLAGAETADEFDEVWAEFYDTADYHRCWIQTR